MPSSSNSGSSPIHRSRLRCSTRRQVTLASGSRRAGLFAVGGEQDLGARDRIANRGRHALGFRSADLDHVARVRDPRIGFACRELHARELRRRFARRGRSRTATDRSPAPPRPLRRSGAGSTGDTRPSAAPARPLRTAPRPRRHRSRADPRRSAALRAARSRLAGEQRIVGLGRRRARRRRDLVDDARAALGVDRPRRDLFDRRRRRLDDHERHRLAGVALRGAARDRDRRAAPRSTAARSPAGTRGRRSRDASITSSSERLPSISRRIGLLSSGTSPSRAASSAVSISKRCVERRQLLEQARPLVEAAHALHQQALRARRDHLAAAHGAEHDLELALAPGQQAIDRVLALQRAGLGVDHLAVAEVDRRLCGWRSPTNWITPDLRLTSIVWITSTTGMSATRPANRIAVLALVEVRALPLLQQDVDPRDDLFDVDRLGQVVVDAELEAADLVLDRGLGGEEHERDLGPVGRRRARGDAARSRRGRSELRLRDDEIGRVRARACRARPAPTRRA